MTDQQPPQPYDTTRLGKLLGELFQRAAIPEFAVEDGVSEETEQMLMDTFAYLNDPRSTKIGIPCTFAGVSGHIIALAQGMVEHPDMPGQNSAVVAPLVLVFDKDTLVEHLVIATPPSGVPSVRLDELPENLDPFTIGASNDAATAALAAMKPQPPEDGSESPQDGD